MKDALLINKLAAGMIGAMLLAMVAGGLSKILYHPHELEEKAFPIAVQETASASQEAEAPAGPEPVSPLLASADPANGEKLFKKCAACHTVGQGEAHKVGPNLWNVVERPKGSTDFGGYSDGMHAKGGSWSYEDLNHFLLKPKDFVTGTAMNFAGFKKVSDRADIIAYLREHADAPVALP